MATAYSLGTLLDYTGISARAIDKYAAKNDWHEVYEHAKALEIWSQELLKAVEPIITTLDETDSQPQPSHLDSP